MRSVSPQPRNSVPKPHAPSTKAKSGIPRLDGAGQQRQASALPEVVDMDVFSENQLLGRLVQDMQAKLSLSAAEVKRLSEDVLQREGALTGLHGQLDRCRTKIEDLRNENEALRAANASLVDARDNVHAQKMQLEGVVVDLTRQLTEKSSAASQLQGRCDELEQQLQQRREGGVTAEHISQQLQGVESMYRSRLEAVKEECREKLAAQEATARARLVEAQAAATQMVASVKRAAVREVQRAEASLEGKVQDQQRVLDQLSKRCRALEARTADIRPLVMAASEARTRVVELEQQLRTAEEAADAAAAAVSERSACAGCHSCCCCCCYHCAGESDAAAELNEELAGVQQRLLAARREMVGQAELVAQLQSDLVAAQQAKVAIEERLESVEAICGELRSENVSLRMQLLSVAALGGATRQSEAWQGSRIQDSATHSAVAAGSDQLAPYSGREAAAQAAALRAAQADAATRELLQSARREQVAASLALLSQLRRMQALEGMRLRDLQEIYELERQLARHTGNLCSRAERS